MKVYDFIAFLSFLSCAVVFGQEQQAQGQAQVEHKEAEQQQKTSSHQQDPRKLVKDAQHIKEHLKSEYGFSEEQAEKYLQQYDAQTQFFLMHDYDNNTKLDGLELLKSMTHHHDDEPNENQDSSDQTDTLVEFVDMVMKDQDVNDDGYVDYPEYISYYTKFDKDTHSEVSTDPPVASS